MLSLYIWIIGRSPDTSISRSTDLIIISLLIDEIGIWCKNHGYIYGSHAHDGNGPLMSRDRSLRFVQDEQYDHKVLHIPKGCLRGGVTFCCDPGHDMNLLSHCADSNKLMFTRRIMFDRCVSLGKISGVTQSMVPAVATLYDRGGMNKKKAYHKIQFLFEVSRRDSIAKILQSISADQKKETSLWLSQLSV